MFPLGSTVFPQQVVPLHIFEERYRTLLEHVTADDDSPGFGIAVSYTHLTLPTKA